MPAEKGESKMKLYNRTKVPDAVLGPLLMAAGRAVGARTGGVIVKVAGGRHLSGTAYGCNKLRFNYRGGYDYRKGHWVKTDSGYIQFTLAMPGRAPTWYDASTVAKMIANFDPLERAEATYRLALHEWAHIRDFQQGTRFCEPRTLGGRRPRHDDRPVEIAAYRQVRDAEDRQRVGRLASRDDLILALAVWFNEARTAAARKVASHA
jgi:hypothetical protein